MGKIRGCDESGILNADSVVHFVAFLEPTQNGNGILHTGLLDHHRLEAPFQGRILLDVFAILIKGGRSNAP